MDNMFFQFKVLVTKIPKGFCSVTSADFKSFIKRLKSRLSIDLVCFRLVDITIVFVFSTFIIIFLIWHYFSIFLRTLCKLDSINDSL